MGEIVPQRYLPAKEELTEGLKRQQAESLAQILIPMPATREIEHRKVMLMTKPGHLALCVAPG